jgi:hypothetical protein
MEKPYNGRAVLHESPGELEIVIPTEKKWSAILFLGVWLFGWAVGEVYGIDMLIGQLGRELEASSIFVSIWLVLWTVGGITVIRALLWSLLGEETITIGQGQLSIFKKGDLFAKTKTYDLREAKKFRANEIRLPVKKEENQIGHINFGTMEAIGTICFNYGLHTVRFADSLPEVEANYILDKLKAMRILDQGHF